MATPSRRSGASSPDGQTTTMSRGGTSGHQTLSDRERVVAYANRFSIKLFKNLAALDARSTVCVGPFTIFKTLCMAYAGAKDNTEHQMAKAFKVNKRFDMSGAFQKLLEALNKPVPNVRQETYTRVFFERSLEVTKGFRSVMDRNFNAELDTVDMRGEPDSVRECVNSSVEKDTVGAIPQLLVSGVTDADTCAVFYDAVYVKASWDKAFPAVAAATEKHPFTECTATSHSGALASGSERAAELVRITGVYRHCRDAENKLLAVEVPLSSDKLSMVLFMADNTPSLRRFHKHLSLEQYERVLDKLEATGERISVLVPKMHVEESVQPSYTLRHMGFLDLLDEHAMLSGIASNLFVSDIIHKVSFTLDTTGITAAAAVSLSLTNFYTEELPKAYRDCQSSRPFIYVVKNKETDLILFMGAVQDI